MGRSRRIEDSESEEEEEEEQLEYTDQSEDEQQIHSNDDEAEEYTESEGEYNDEDDEEDEDEDEEEEEEEDTQPQLDKMKRSLAHVSFEKLAQIKNKMGMEKEDQEQTRRKISKDQILKDLQGAASQLKKKDRVKKTKAEMKRADKHSPMEMSFKKAVSRFREVVEVNKPRSRDPRFDKLSGHFNKDLFEKSYSFLEDYKQSEKVMVHERIRKEKNPEERERLERLLQKMISREISAKQLKRKQELLRERKKAEAELVKQGKRPYFLKRSEKRKLELMDRYANLDESKMDKILEKRRKKNAAKDHRHLPFKRRS